MYFLFFPLLLLHVARQKCSPLIARLCISAVMAACQNLFDFNFKKPWTFSKKFFFSFECFSHIPWECSCTPINHWSGLDTVNLKAGTRKLKKAGAGSNFIPRLFVKNTVWLSRTLQRYRYRLLYCRLPQLKQRETAPIAITRNMFVLYIKIIENE